MSQVRSVDPFLYALDGDDGAKVAHDADGYVTLGVDTYYIPFGGTADQPLESLHIITDAVIAGTFTIQTSNVPRTGTDGQVPPGGCTDWTEAAADVGKWVTENPTGAYVAVEGTGWTWTVLSGAKTAGLGGAMLHLGNLGSKRGRIKAVITTGGKVAVCAHGKSG